MGEPELYYESNPVVLKKSLRRKLNGLGLTLTCSFLLSILLSLLFRFYGIRILFFMMRSFVSFLNTAFPASKEYVAEFTRTLYSNYSVLQIIEMAFYFICSFLPFYVYIKIKKNSIGTYFHVDGKLPKGFFLFAMLTVSASYMVSFFPSLSDLFSVGHGANPSAYSSVPNSLPQLFLALLSTAILPPILEEFIFRGIILSELMPYGKTFAILASAFLFGISHATVEKFAFAMLVGIFLALFTVETGSLKTAIFIHMINNTFSVINPYLLTHLPKFAGDLYWSVFFSILFVLGLLGLVFFLSRPIVEQKSLLPTQTALRCLISPVILIYLLVMIIDFFI